jgi:tetratricopeptide (TPR) repeat protein
MTVPNLLGGFNSSFAIIFELVQHEVCNAFGWGICMSKITCPACHQIIPADRLLAGTAYCSCGCSIAFHERRRDRVSSFPLVVFSVILVSVILHVLNWDTYALQVLPLKLKQLTGMAREAELVELANICQARQKPQCEIQALGQAYQLNNKNIPLLLRKANLHHKLNEHQAVVLTLSTYYKKGGKDFSSRHNYAIALGEVGQTVEAQKQFRYILRLDNKKPQFQVARSYVDMLMKQRDYTTAKTVIEDYRRSAPQAGLFLEKELKYINQSLNVAQAPTSNLVRKKVGYNNKRRSYETFDN